MRFLILLAVVLTLASCGNRSGKPDVSDIKVDVSIERFEQSFFKIDTNHLDQGLQQLRQQYPGFYNTYMYGVLQMPQPPGTPAGALPAYDPSWRPHLMEIFRSYAPINDSVQKKYRNVNFLKEDVAEGFRHVKYYYPSYRLPRLITFLATFDAPGVVLTPAYLGIGLQQYAGKNFSVYAAPQIQELYPSYISRRFDKEYMATNCLKSIVDDIYPDTSIGKPLIVQMIEKGKQWYLLDHFMPDTPDSLKTGYTQKQVDWCRQNEGNIWGYFTKNADLYSINIETIQDFLGEAPSTQAMTDAAPGNIGQWTGWQIVTAFAQKNPALTVQQVLSTPATTIFQQAKYRPK